jgi:hypothetical protein
VTGSNLSPNKKFANISLHAGQLVLSLQLAIFAAWSAGLDNEIVISGL